MSNSVFLGARATVCGLSNTNVIQSQLHHWLMHVKCWLSDKCCHALIMNFFMINKAIPVNQWAGKHCKDYHIVVIKL